MLVKILVGLTVLIGLLLGYVALQPKNFAVSREIKIAASPEKVFPHLNDVKKANAWNPFLKADQGAKITYFGPAAGVGAGNSWDGDSQVGKGSATIVESIPGSAVRLRLDYEKPFKGTNTVTYALKSEGKETTVSWSIAGESAFVPRLFCTLFFMNMDKMIGNSFEKGLADLKAIVETETKK
ncbi:MAG: SRPBCC family protein [Bacteriovoracia bacterium]